ncbi:glycerol-3-phosphate dehydrogenase/oxidase [Fulvivirgaceae bacterium BMA10]|uniref:Glycerol-3-phosphate dehydrogenase n=1 Tax=Splendidivirga corallicola TaxID=3051826 RepID=A0ABT8KTZ8_9BACT|nr:glycerol-3-phosphate dehydrogenase/oxidase [Fulvivirgaceae bacterium BMA10]
MLLKRDELLENLKSETFDLLIIGGGITGCGTALDAASRGLKTALIEKWDFASGTSSRSTKLIHGGLRYLKQLEIGLVREVGRERAIVHQLAPHLVTPEKMLLPIIKDGTFGKFMTSIGLWIYDALANVEDEDQRKMLSKEEAYALEPLLNPETLEGAGLYAEYRTDDSRLTIEVMKTAAHQGATCLNYIQANNFIYENDQVVGAHCEDTLTRQSFNINARYIVNAAGPWVDELREKDGSKTGKGLHLTKGVHIVVPHHKLPVRQSIYFDVADGRMIFAIPRGLVTYIGTTDTDYDKDKDEVVANKEDVAYLIEAINQAFPNITLNIEDVESSWAGLRPLIHESGKSSTELSRKDEIFESPTGLISIAGGKLTGYRKMAERVVDEVVDKYQDKYNQSFKDCYTDEIYLSGGAFDHEEEVKKYIEEISEITNQLALPGYLPSYLVHNYGRQTQIILEIFRNNANQDPEIALAIAEASYTMQYELAQRPNDFFTRRSGRLYFNINSLEKIKEPVLQLFCEYFRCSDETMVQYRDVLEKRIQAASCFN